jgi:integrase
MGLFKRGGVYWYEFIYEGRRIRRSSNVKNQRDAGEIERAYRTALAKGEVGITKRKPIPCFRVAMDGFIKWSFESHKKASHVRYKTSSVALLKHFRDMQLDKITPEEVERFKTTRAFEYKTVRGNGKRVKTDKRIRPATVNRELACLKALFHYAIKADVLAKNPVSKVKMLAEDNLQTRVLTFTEQQKYLAKATDVATLMLETGMRPEEVYTIRPENACAACRDAAHRANHRRRTPGNAAATCRRCAPVSPTVGRSRRCPAQPQPAERSAKAWPALAPSWADDSTTQAGHAAPT